MEKKKKLTEKNQSTKTKNYSFLPLITIIVLGAIALIVGYIVITFPTIVSTIVAIFIIIVFILLIYIKFSK